ncbi:uncharacterized protein LOC108673542 [Hyalella azteca]|uniref:Uncharacterized protein LOC108673542 n=1 Tax=Hyalella azteca TaxID=294128 RepID=A0A8B7NT38_HYAAZ|nr:uncharacterized protein LOC108673542 [Hyalella azteca]
MPASCIICEEVFLPNIEVSATPCGHIFHTTCVAQWFERSKSCPKCRFSGKMKLLRLHFDESNSEDNQDDADTLKSKLDNAEFPVSLKEKELEKLKEDVTKQKEISDKLRTEVIKLERQLSSMKAELQVLRDAQQRSEDLRLERDTARAKLSSLQDFCISGASKSSRARLESSDSSTDSLDRLPSPDPPIQPPAGLSTNQHASGLSSTDQNLGSASRLSSTDLHLQHYAMNATVEGAGCSQVKPGPLQLSPRRAAGCSQVKPGPLQLSPRRAAGCSQVKPGPLQLSPRRVAGCSKKEHTDYLNLKVENLNGQVAHFKIKQHTSLEKLMSAYCARIWLPQSTMRFIFNGKRLSDNDTPNGLNMEDGDTIYVYQYMKGGGMEATGGHACVRPQNENLYASDISIINSILNSAKSLDEMKLNFNPGFDP